MEIICQTHSSPHMQFRTSLDKPCLSEGRKEPTQGKEKYVCHIQQPSSRVTETGLFSSFLNMCWLNSSSHFYTSAATMQRILKNNQRVPFSLMSTIQKDTKTESVSRMTCAAKPV